jgi:hypothetical protein
VLFQLLPLVATLKSSSVLSQSIRCNPSGIFFLAKTKRRAMLELDKNPRK